MAKKQVVRSLSLFETNEAPTQAAISSPPLQEPPKIKDACPKCHGKSLKTARPYEHDNHTHYCVSGCMSEDRYDAFYFTPAAEEPAREEAKEAKEAVTSEPVEVETETIGEGEQVALIETGEKWEEEWRGMPEFVQEDLMPWHSVEVHFENREDMEKFSKLVKQKIGLNTKFIWYPQAEINRAQTKKLVDSKP